MLRVEDLHVKFRTSENEAVQGVSFSIGDGEIVGLVGESGSGKTVTALSIAGLHSRSGCTITGRIELDGSDILTHDRHHGIHRVQISMVFQDPQTALDPLMRVGRQVEEPLKIHTKMKKDERKKAALAAMEAAGLNDAGSVFDKYPFELSGGMQQRVMIAAAIVSNPKLLLLDEPTTALDVTTQAQIIELLKKLNREKGIAMLFISHDLNLVRKLCTHIAVMQSGKIVETGGADEVFFSPKHEYTKRLIASVPSRRREGGR